MDRKYFAAALFVLASLASYSVASWSYLGVVGVVSGTVQPGGITRSFNVDLGVIYSGMSKTVNASAEIIMPVERQVKFYGVEDVGDGPISARPDLVNYTVSVFLDDYTNYLGEFSNTENLTITLPQGEHTLYFIIRVDAPVVESPINFTITIYMTT